jgi:hypothetical protein
VGDELEHQEAIERFIDVASGDAERTRHLVSSEVRGSIAVGSER